MSFLPPIAYFLCALGYAALWSAASARVRRTPSDVALARLRLASVVSILWSLAGTLATLRTLPVAGIVYEYLDVLRYAAWFGFIATMMTAGRSGQTFCTDSVVGKIWPVMAMLVFIAILSQAGLLVNVGSTSNLVQLKTYSSICLAACSLVAIEQLARSALPDSKWRLKPIVIGLGAGFAYDIYMFSSPVLFARLDSDAYQFRGLAHLLTIPFIAMFLTRSGRRPLAIVLSQSAAIHTAALAATGLYLIATGAAGYYVRYRGGTWAGGLSLILVFSALVLLAFVAASGTARARVRVFVGKHFLRYRYDYREEWQKFTHGLVEGASPDLIGQRVIRALADIVESPAGILWALDSGETQYRIVSRWNAPECQAIEPVRSDFVDYLSSPTHVIDLAEFRVRPGRYGPLHLPNWLDDIRNAWLVIPLCAGGRLIGFTVLTTSRAPIEVNWEVKDLITTASLQAASFLSLVQTTDALLEARKFEAFNRMSAFVVHDLKNIIAQLSLMLRNAERHRDNPAFQSDMLMTVGHSVDRMKQLMLQLREGANPGEHPGFANLKTILEQIRRAKDSQRPRIDVSAPEGMMVRGRPDLLERVIGHLAQNAIDATPETGRIWLTLSREGSSAVLAVGDTGRGMSEEFVQHQLFKPFNTTKNTGMGIGAFESMHYIRELGGQILVTSKLGEGTIFTLKLPLLEAALPQDTADRENN